MLVDKEKEIKMGGLSQFVLILSAILCMKFETHFHISCRPTWACTCDKEGEKTSSQGANQEGTAEAWLHHSAKG